MNKTFIFLSLLSLSGFAAAGAEMKLEGNCHGKVRGEEVTLKYFSTFDGCINKSKAKVVMTTPKLRNLKGTRSIEKGFDTYSFSGFWLVFKDSTGNTQGEYRYRGAGGVVKSVQLNCEIRDYEYSECSGL